MAINKRYETKILTVMARIFYFEETKEDIYGS